jgi:hypothetical protein
MSWIREDLANLEKEDHLEPFCSKVFSSQLESLRLIPPNPLMNLEQTSFNARFKNKNNEEIHNSSNIGSREYVEVWYS